NGFILPCNSFKLNEKRRGGIRSVSCCGAAHVKLCAAPLRTTVTACTSCPLTMIGCVMRCCRGADFAIGAAAKLTRLTLHAAESWTLEMIADGAFIPMANTFGRVFREQE